MSAMTPGRDLGAGRGPGVPDHVLGQGPGDLAPDRGQDQDPESLPQSLARGLESLVPSRGQGPGRIPSRSRRVDPIPVQSLDQKAGVGAGAEAEDVDILAVMTDQVGPQEGGTSEEVNATGGATAGRRMRIRM